MTYHKDYFKIFNLTIFLLLCSHAFGDGNDDYPYFSKQSTATQLDINMKDGIHKKISSKELGVQHYEEAVLGWFKLKDHEYIDLFIRAVSAAGEETFRIELAKSAVKKKKFRIDLASIEKKEISDFVWGIPKWPPKYDYSETNNLGPYGYTPVNLYDEIFEWKVIQVVDRNLINKHYMVDFQIFPN